MTEVDGTIDCFECEIKKAHGARRAALTGGRMGGRGREGEKERGRKRLKHLRYKYTIP